MIIYRHYLTIGSSRTEAFPLGFLDSTLSDEQENEQIFYSRKFNGTLTFVNNNGDDDFDLLYANELIDPCGKILYEVERSGVAYWRGYFPTTDGKFDLDRCTFEVTPLPDDDYFDIMDKQEIQYNIILMPTGDVPIISTTAVIPNGATIAFTRNRFLFDVIKYIADQLVPGVIVSSDFFTNATNPVTLHANKLLYLTIAQKSDIIRPTSSNQANSAMMSWKELMDILWAMFQVKWNYIPGTNTINVEHISFWTHPAELDLRSQLIAKATNKYTYQKEKMPKYEKFSFMEADDPNFAGTPIRYDSACVNPDPKSNIKETLVNVTTDLEYIINNPDAISDDGFVILCNYMDGGSYYVLWGVGSMDSLVVLNVHLSWANLHDSYYRHNRVLIEGYLNGNLTTFWSAQKNILQPCYAIICPSDNYDPNDAITTELGETYLTGVKANVKSSELNPNGEMSFSLVYGPGDNENTGVEEMGSVIITQGIDCISLEANMSKPMDINRNIIVTYQVFDSVGGLVCASDPETRTILAGATTSSFTLSSPCQVGTEGYQYVITLNISGPGPGGWTYEYFDCKTCLPYI